LAEVVIQESESLENALRRFKRKVQQEDIIKEIKKHSFYMKPGEKRGPKKRFRGSDCARSSVANRINS
jgi:small subunit ribosomal protein S21